MIAAFDAAFRGATGSSPTWAGKALALVDRLARLHPLEVIERRIRRCYGERLPRWLWDGGVPDIGSFASNFDKFSEPVAAVTNSPPTWTRPRPPIDSGTVGQKEQETGNA